MYARTLRIEGGLHHASAEQIERWKDERHALATQEILKAMLAGPHSVLNAYTHAFAHALSHSLSLAGLKAKAPCYSEHACPSGPENAFIAAQCRLLRIYDYISNVMVTVHVPSDPSA